jgi:phosphatidylinositol alpha-1,6-mannosyltransferase
MAENDLLRLVLLTEVFLPHAGGSRYYYFNLFRRMAGLHCDVTVLTKKTPGWQAFDTQEQASSFRIRRHFEPLADVPRPRWAQALGLLNAGACSTLTVTAAAPLFQRTDVLHCGDLYPPGALGLILKKAFRLPLIAYSHGEDITLVDSLRFQPKLRDLIYRTADAVIANGDFAIRNLQRIGIDRAKIHKITPGLDTSVFCPQPPDRQLRELYGITEEVVILTVGRLVPRKGQDRVLRALAAIAAKVPRFKYIIVGQGPEEAALVKLAAGLNLQDRVVFAGLVTDESLNRYYNLADIFVMPNRDVAGDVEGFGMVFLEANAAGKPVIAGRSGGAIEAVDHGKTGFLVDPGDDGELRDALQTLLSNHECRQSMGAAGLHRVRSEFDWDSRAARLREISAEVAVRGCGAPR